MELYFSMESQKITREDAKLITQKFSFSEVEVKVFDSYNPSSNKSLKNIRREIEDKARKQADRIVITMEQSQYTPRELKNYLNTVRVSPKVKEVISIQNGKVYHSYLSK